LGETMASTLVQDLYARANAIAGSGATLGDCIAALDCLKQALPFEASLSIDDRARLRAGLAEHRERLFDLDPEADAGPLLTDLDAAMRLGPFKQEPVFWGLCAKARIRIAYKMALRTGDRTAILQAAHETELLAAKFEPLAQAPSAMNSALVPPPGPMTVLWIQTLLAAAEWYLEGADEGDRASVERAVSCSGKGLEPLLPHTAPELWAQGCLILSGAFIRRSDFGVEADIKRAAMTAQYVTQAASPSVFPDVWLLAQLNLAIACRHMPDWSPSDGIETALTLLEDEAVAALRPVFPLILSKIDTELASLYLKRMQGQLADNIEYALAAADRVITMLQSGQDQQRLASAYKDRGFALQLRPIGDRVANLENAIASYRAGLAISGNKGTTHHAAILQDLGTAYQVRMVGVRSENLNEARIQLEDALVIWKHIGRTKEEARTHLNLGNVERERGYAGLSWSLDRVQYHYGRAVSLAEQVGASLISASARIDFASALALDTNPARWDRAVTNITLALQVIDRASHPDKHARASRLLGALAFRQERWADAVAAFDAAFEAFGELVGTGANAIELRRSARELSGTGELAAYASLRLADLTGALTRLDRGRAQELGVSLNGLVELTPAERAEADRLRADIRRLERLLEDAESDHQHILDEVASLRAELVRYMPFAAGAPNLDLSQASDDHWFLIPVVTTAGTDLLLAKGGQTARLEAYTLSDSDLSRRIDEVVRDWIDVTSPVNGAMDPALLFNAIRQTMDELFDCFIKPMREILARSGVEVGDRLVAIFPGKLSVLPVLWAGDERSLAANYHVRLAPSIRASIASEQRSPHEGMDLAAIANPLGDLGFASLEAKVAASIFGLDRSIVLDGQNATLEATISALRTASHWLFSTHAHFDPVDARQSSITLAGDASLTLGLLLEQANIGSPDVVILSACESGIHDISQAPDEFFGLPGAFLQFGAGTVVGNLWPVSDLSASLLMARMFNELREGVRASEALRVAQIWLQDSTGSAITSWVKNNIARAAWPDGFETLLGQLQATGEERPFAHPFNWASAIAYGR
jgi:CHAT domain-containing protein